jgi:hypothetical protein
VGNIRQRQFYTYKFKTSRLKEFNYDVTLDFNQARLSKELIALADNQVLRSIRDIRGRQDNFGEIEYLYRERDRVKSGKAMEVSDPQAYVAAIQKQIDDNLFVPEYITIVVEDKSHYQRIYEHGVKINGHTFHRFSCSAGQARVSTVALVDDEIADELRRRINNGRDMSVPLAPSKLNAYFGLSTSATHIVSEPRFIVVKDFENKCTFTANFVTETGENEDDIVESRDVTLDMNRTDGMGLISPAYAQRWADDMGLDYIPAQWIVRQSFLKGMLCTFDFHKFCEEVNGGKYLVETIYKNADGDPIFADLRECDVIVTESMFKLWDSYPSLQAYIDHYRANKLYWGVSRAVPKEDTNVLGLNYQFIQTLDLTRDEIETLCSQFVEWLQGVSYENVYYMMLFVLGVKNTPESISEFLRSGDNYWLKSLVVNHDIRNDKFVRTKIRDLIRKRIHDGCMGKIFVNGNYQMLVSDPYGFMQHVCGLPVTGLLREGEFFSAYWNGRGVTQVDAMRSPLTYRSEHVILNMRDDPEVRKWYKYCYSGIILNYHGHEVVNFAGADFDGDILATTDNAMMIKGVYLDEKPVVYDAPKAKKKNIEDKDLYISDTFSFGSIIGSITNKGSNAYALLPNLVDRYGCDSNEVSTTISRLKQCCKAQSAQIDMAKLGQKVKGIPSVWIKNTSKRENPTSDDIFNSSILLNTAPYFFKYRYRDTRQKYNKYVDENKASCLQRFGKQLNELLKENSPTEEESAFIQNYYIYMPVTVSKSTMNMLCEYIEGVNFKISKKVKSPEEVFNINVYKNTDYPYTCDEYNAVVAIIKSVTKRYSSAISLQDDEHEDQDEKWSELSVADAIESKLNAVVLNQFVVTNILVDYFYVERPNSDKSILWDVCGKYIYKNVKSKSSETILFPIPDESGNITYMGGRYDLREVQIDG